MNWRQDFSSKNLPFIYLWKAEQESKHIYHACYYSTLKYQSVSDPDYIYKKKIIGNLQLWVIKIGQINGCF